MEIKKIAPEDFQGAATVLRNYWKERGMHYSPEWALHYLTQGHQTDIKRDQCFVLKESDKVIGTISLMILEGDVAEIRDLVVRKEYRQKGHGKKLLEYIMEYAKHNAVRKIYALIFRQYRLFFEKYGFALEGFLQNHFKDGEHLLIMSKMLGQKEEKQVDLKQKLETDAKLQEIEQETAERLQKLALR